VKIEMSLKKLSIICLILMLATVAIVGCKALPNFRPPPIPPSPFIPPGGGHILPPKNPFIFVYAILAVDEEFVGDQLQGIGYAQLEVERVKSRLEYQYGITIEIVDIVGWNSDNSKSGSSLFYEAVEETGFYSGMVRNGFEIDALIAFTGQYLGYGGLCWIEKSALIVQYQGYWCDDNVLQHEVSHLFYADDGVQGTSCYILQCVMSYHTVAVETVEEDEETYNVYAEVPEGYLANTWCADHYKNITLNKFRYTVVGDMNNDDRVSISDIVTIAIFWGYNDPRADLNGDYKTTISDIVRAALHWGETKN